MRSLTLVLAVVLLVAAPEGPSGTAAQPAGKIVYSHRFWPKTPQVTDNWELFVKTLGGGDSVRLTRNPGRSDVFPSWSPEGRWIAFACGWGPSAGVYVIGADGRRRWPAVKLPNWRIEGVAWSPDARRIAFGASGIWVVNAVGGGLRRLTKGDDSSPTWSRDSRSIAYEHGSDVFLVRTDGTGSRRVIRRADKPAWSPDGRRIAFRRGTDIWIANVDGTGRRRLKCCRRTGVTALTWSPDSRYLAYDGGGGIHVMRLEGTGGRIVAGGAELLGFSWARSDQG